MNKQIINFFSALPRLNLIPLASGEYAGEAKEQAEGRAENVNVLFNAATLPFYWAGFEPQRGTPITEKSQKRRPLVSRYNMVTKDTPSCLHS